MSAPELNRQSTTLPYTIYYILTFLLALSGLFASLYLSYTHYKNYTDLTYSSFCAISNALNCDTVSQSSWSLFFSLPVSWWGILGYCLLLVILAPLYKPRSSFNPLWSVLFLLTLVFSAFSLYFSYITTTKIGSYCIFCIATHLINFSLAYWCWLICRRFRKKKFYHDIKNSLLANKYIPGVMALFLITVGTLYYVIQPPYWLYSSDLDYSAIDQGITIEGHPWLGAENPVLTIAIYSDYQCFQCSKIHQSLIRLIQDNPDKIRLVHHHYPLDHTFNPIVVKDPFHVGSGKMALLAIYAATEGKFWEINDILFEQGRKKESFNIKDIAEVVDVPAPNLAWALSHEGFRNLLNYDIKKGMKLRITATPALVIDNEVYIGNIPPEILQSKLNE